MSTQASNDISNSAQLHSSRPQIAILDFGSQYSHLIARRVRELHVFCELFSCLVDAKTLEANNIRGIILSGGPSSVYEADSPHVHPSVWGMIKERQIPVLGDGSITHYLYICFEFLSWYAAVSADIII